ncbi:hypothetical protein [Parafrankia discariae]|uniref:hypothetical protein n=1 Tax=Parafrankia discariae TaxID=365528 RepID=UPI000380A066|nr:hypothetical protein [Parafrankia discariae]
MRFLDRIPAQRSTLLLGFALAAVFALYIMVRPESLPASRSYTAAVEQAKADRRDEQASATPTPRARASTAPAPETSPTPTASPSPEVTATPTTTADPSGTADPFGSTDPSAVGTSPASAPPFARVPSVSGDPFAPAPGPTATSAP